MKNWNCALGALAFLLAGCGDNELGVEKVRPNQPPETVLATGPPDSTDFALYRVQLFWSGTDRDGTVSHYDFIMVDHPPIRDHIAGDPDSTRVIVTVPSPDDPRWVGTTATDSTFITLADTLNRNPQPGPGENSDDVRETHFERWHTFFVRAVDNEGMVDATPDYRSFNSKNIAPTVALKPPIVAGGVLPLPPVVVFNWSGDDPVDESTNISPVASRFVNISSKIDINRPGNTYTSFPDSLYFLPDRYQWSEWARWGTGGVGTRAVVSGLARVGDAPGVGYYIFAVQAMDEAGAITPVFDYQTDGKNNVALYRVSGDVGPVLEVREPFLGTQTFVGGSKPIRIDIAGGQFINFRWNADASHYGGEIVAYRYGWDIRNPDNDQEWSSWSLAGRRAPTQSFPSGSHRFFVQVRDNAESITQAIYEMTVYTVTRSRDLLWVDDTDYQTDIASEAADQARWEAVLSEVSSKNGFEFDPGLDVYDVNENRREAPPIQKVFDYRTIVWSNRSGKDLSSGLRRAAQFSDPFPRRNQNTARAFNFINIYLANGGQLWIDGYRAAKQLWPDERPTGDDRYDPVNVTNWDDPIEPHPPGVDSVGTTSLLYMMGIEMFDVGSSLEVNDRNESEDFCYGIERCAVVDSQLTPSNVVSGHAHTLKIFTAEVEAGVTRAYETVEDLSLSPPHRHALTLMAEDFAALKRGEHVVVETDVNDLPVPHTHTFDIVDQLGDWGAPALRTSVRWSQAAGGRSGVEIYNMPSELVTAQPSLIPLAGISVNLYCYVSAATARENPPDFTFPATADNQPVFILAKGNVRDPYYSRAFCGFEVSLLEEVSHRQLAEFILVRHFRLGTNAN